MMVIFLKAFAIALLTHDPASKEINIPTIYGMFYDHIYNHVENVIKTKNITELYRISPQKKTLNLKELISEYKLTDNLTHVVWLGNKSSKDSHLFPTQFVHNEVVGEEYKQKFRNFY